MLVGHYKGRRFLYNQVFMEIYEECDGRLIKKRDFHKWENVVSWQPMRTGLECESIKLLNFGDRPICGLIIAAA